MSPDKEETTRIYLSDIQKITKRNFLMIIALSSPDEVCGYILLNEIPINCEIKGTAPNLDDEFPFDYMKIEQGAAPRVAKTFRELRTKYPVLLQKYYKAVGFLDSNVIFIQPTIHHHKTYSMKAQ